jgi:hypothetical protein
VHRNLLAPFQRSLLGKGIPLAWVVDVGVIIPRSAPSIVVHGGRLDIGLGFEPEAPVDGDRLAKPGADTVRPPETRAQGAARLMR